MTAAKFKTSYDQQGYVVVPGLVDSEHKRVLEEACERIIARTRAGLWPHRRTIGKQFPPYHDENPDSWGVQHVMHPDLGEPSFVQWYTSPKLLAVVIELLGCKETDLQMELFNLLINPLAQDFALRWHRDDIPEDATFADEAKALKVWHHGVQWNTALHLDSCLYIVPATHLTPRTPDQRKLSAGQTLDNPLDMPDSIQLTLQPGETVFYNSNILHCATYNSKEKRTTLHGCMGDAKGGPFRARNVLQHGLGWMKEKKFRDSLPNEISRGMLDKLVEMYNSVGDEVPQYSLKNQFL